MKLYKHYIEKLAFFKKAVQIDLNHPAHKATHKIIAKQFDMHQRKLQLNHHLSNDLGADELDHLDLLLDLEHAHGVWDMDDREASRWKTVKDVHNTVHKYTGMTP